MYRFLFILALIPSMVWCQEDSIVPSHAIIVENNQNNSGIKPNGYQKIFKLFSSGNVDYISGGMLRSRAKIAEVNIGDPEKFYFPVYFMVGAISQPTEEGFSVNLAGTADILNNFGGLINIGTTGKKQIKTIGKSTQFMALYQLALKSVNGVSIEKDASISMFSKLLMTGLEIETKAWNTDKNPSDGKAWLKTYISYSMNDREKITSIYGCRSANNFVGGNVECGLDIKDFADLRFGYHQYLNNQHIPIFEQGIYVFSANFALADKTD